MSARPGLFIFLVTIYIIGVILGATYEKAGEAEWPLATGGSALETMEGVQKVRTLQLQGNISAYEIATPGSDFFSNWKNILVLRFDFIQDPDNSWAMYFWYIVLLPLSIVAITVMVLLLASLLAQLAQALLPW